MGNEGGREDWREGGGKSHRQGAQESIPWGHLERRAGMSQTKEGVQANAARANARKQERS